MWRFCSVILGLGFTWACSFSAQAAEEMQTRVFRMRPEPHDFPGVVNAPPVDARKVLEEAGVTFPAGAEVAFDPLGGFLMVTNTAANLERTRAFVEEISLPQAPTIAFLVTAVAGPGELMRQVEAAATGAEDASKELNLLLNYANNPGSQVRVIGDCFLESTTGTRTSSTELKPGEKAGLKLVVEPILGSDGRSIESTLDLDLPGTPFSAYLRAQSGQTKLAGVTRPAKTAKEADGMLWAVFVTATARRSTGAAMVTLPVVIEDSEAAAAGLQTGVFQVPDGLFEAAGSVPFALQPWLASQGITFDAGAKVSHKGGVLRMTNTQVNIGRMTVLVERFLEGSLKTGLWTLHTFEAPATLLRGLAQRTAARTDDAAMLATVQSTAEKGEARCVDFVFLDSKPDAKSQWQAGHDRWQVSSVDQDAAGRLRLGLGPRFVGTRLEVEMATSPYSRRLEVEVSHEIHPPGPDEEPVTMIDPDTKQPRDLPAINYHPAKTRRKLALLPGDTRLLALREPVGRSASGMLWATFLRCTTPPNVPPPPPPPPPAEKKEAGPAPDPQGWETRSFRVPSEFLSSCCGHEPDKPRLTERSILEIQGIPFPSGATAVFTPATRTLQVRNTRENLDLVEEYVKTITANPPATIVLDAQILQGSGDLLRRLAVATTGPSDHRAALDELLAAVKAGTVRRIDTARITTRSGTPASSERTTEHTHNKSVGKDDKGAAVFEQEKRAVGWSLKMEPTIGADGCTVHLTVKSEFHTGEPQEHVQNVLDHGRLLEVPLTEYHFHQVQTHLSMPGGTARLVSVWKPTGKPEFEKEDILQVMFITCDVLRGPLEEDHKE